MVADGFERRDDVPAPKQAFAFDCDQREDHLRSSRRQAESSCEEGCRRLEALRHARPRFGRGERARVRAHRLALGLL